VSGKVPIPAINRLIDLLVAGRVPIGAKTTNKVISFIYIEYISHQYVERRRRLTLFSQHMPKPKDAVDNLFSNCVKLFVVFLPETQLNVYTFSHISVNP
jgi:hypothetical protein